MNSEGPVEPDFDVEEMQRRVYKIGGIVLALALLLILLSAKTMKVDQVYQPPPKVDRNLPAPLPK